MMLAKYKYVTQTSDIKFEFQAQEQAIYLRGALGFNGRCHESHP
jgi:hypothetical protein